ncbi:GNAT family N-acetyltransferase [Virgibacillus ainsalahensis]
MENIHLLLESDYDEIFSLSQFAFQYNLSEEQLKNKKEEAKRHTIWGWIEGEQLAAKLHLIPLSVYIQGKPFKMGGISGVATWPEYRRNGMVKHLLYRALKEMKENGQAVSLLHPFAFPFYRKYGWEHAFSRKHYSMPLEKLKKDWDVNGYVRRIKEDIPLLHRLYTEYAKKYNGMLTRDEKWWTQRVLKDEDHIAVAYDEAGNAEGYVRFEVKKSILTVKEMVYLNLNSYKQLLKFIGNHDSMAETVEMIAPEHDNLSLYIEEPRFEQKINPYFMARIVDVRRFLEEYPFQGNGELTIAVEDEFFPENSGTYYINKMAESTEISNIGADAGEEAVQCSVQILAGMLFGYMRPVDYYEAGLLHAEKEEVKQLEVIIPNQQTFLADFF